jgi:hypothetical protein
MRLATWNVEYARGLVKNRLRRDLLLEADSDVWVLTETHDELALTEAYVPVRSSAQPSRPGSRWVTVWSRLPILEIAATVDPSRTAAALLDTPSGPLLVYGTVMPWHADAGPDGTAKNWSEHHRVIPEQGRGVAAPPRRVPGGRGCASRATSTPRSTPAATAHAADASYWPRRSTRPTSLASRTATRPTWPIRVPSSTTCA